MRQDQPINIEPTFYDGQTLPDEKFVLPLEKIRCLDKLVEIQDRLTPMRQRKNKLHPGTTKDPNYSELELKKSKRKGRFSNYPTGIDKLKARVKTQRTLLRLIDRVGKENPGPWMNELPQTNSSTENGKP